MISLVLITTLLLCIPTLYAKEITIEQPPAIGYQQLVFNILRANTGLKSNNSATQNHAKYIIDLRQWPKQISSWCEGENLKELPFCGPKKGSNEAQEIVKTQIINEQTFKLEQISEHLNMPSPLNTAEQQLRLHQITYQPQHKRLKVKLKSTDAKGATIGKANIIAKAPIKLVSFELLLLHRFASQPMLTKQDNLHWLEPKRSKRIALSEGISEGMSEGMSEGEQKNKVNINHLNPRTNQQVKMFTINYDPQGLPTSVQSASFKWRLSLANQTIEAQP